MLCNNEKRNERQSLKMFAPDRHIRFWGRSTVKENETINCSKVQWKQKMSQFSVKTSGIEGSLPEK